MLICPQNIKSKAPYRAAALQAEMTYAALFLWVQAKSPSMAIHRASSFQGAALRSLLEHAGSRKALEGNRDYIALFLHSRQMRL